MDLETGAIVSVTVQGADRGDTQTRVKTLTEAAEKVEQALPEGTRHRRGGGRQGGSQHAGRWWDLDAVGIAQLCERNRGEGSDAGQETGRGRKRCMRIGGASGESEGSGRLRQTRRAAGATLCASVRERRDETAACTGT